MKATDDLIRLLGVGAHLDISNGSKSTDDLIRLAAMAAGKQVRLRINGAKATDDLIRIVAAGRGHVEIYFAD